MFEYEYKYIAIRAFWIFALLSLFAVARSTGKKRVDYTMDFLIITPKEIIKFDQTGVLERETENIPADKIKSISVKKKGLLNSLFDIGAIVFLSEGDNDKGDIVMEYVDAVESTEKNIRHILGMDHA